MYPQQHIIYGAIFSILIFWIVPEIGLSGALIIFFSSFLIDVDHYLMYISRKKDFNIFNAYSWHKKLDELFLTLPRSTRNKTFIGVCFLHGIELIILLIVISVLINKIFLFFAIGFIFHLSLDLIQQKAHYIDRPDKVSLIHDVFQSKRLKPLIKYSSNI